MMAYISVSQSGRTLLTDSKRKMVGELEMGLGCEGEQQPVKVWDSLVYINRNLCRSQMQLSSCAVEGCVF